MRKEQIRTCQVLKHARPVPRPRTTPKAEHSPASKQKDGEPAGTVTHGSIVDFSVRLTRLKTLVSATAAGAHDGWPTPFVRADSIAQRGREARKECVTPASKWETIATRSCFHRMRQRWFPRVIHLLPRRLPDVRPKSRLNKSIIWFPTERSVQMLSITKKNMGGGAPHKTILAGIQVLGDRGRELKILRTRTKKTDPSLKYQLCGLQRMNPSDASKTGTFPLGPPASRQ